MYDLIAPFIPWLAAAVGLVLAALGYGKVKKTQAEAEATMKEATQVKAEAAKTVAVQEAASNREVETVKNANDVAADVNTRAGSAADRLRESKWNRDTKAGGDGS